MEIRIPGEQQGVALGSQKQPRQALLPIPAFPCQVGPFHFLGLTRVGGSIYYQFALDPAWDYLGNLPARVDQHSILCFWGLFINAICLCIYFYIILITDFDQELN